ncbi:MAG: hypothetical protein ACYCRD_05990 [Leptospirillum sp.]
MRKGKSAAWIRVTVERKGEEKRLTDKTGYGRAGFGEFRVNRLP